MKYPVFKSIIILILSFSVLSLANSCTKEEEDACVKSEAAQKVANAKVFLSIVDQAGTPVAEEAVKITISHFACGSDITIIEDAVAFEEFLGVTDEFGMFESDNVNFVLNNTQDRVVAHAVAPNLDYYQQNYHREIRYYDQIQGTGQDEFFLTIVQKTQN